MVRHTTILSERISATAAASGALKQSFATHATKAFDGLVVSNSAEGS